MEMAKKRRKISSCLEEPKIDRISNLPESIQSHIFSYLPMEDAIRARILSREWKHVCAPIPNLDFDQQQFHRRIKHKRFHNFVNEILHFHIGLDIQRFSLCANTEPIPHFSLCANTEPIPHFSKWISFAVDHNVQEVVLPDLNFKLAKFPDSLFTCQTLTKLVLCRVHLRVPEFVEFPMLVDVILDDVICDCINPLNQLIRGCHVLEKFSLKTFFWNAQSVIDINTTTVKYLNLQVSAPTHIVKISAANLQEIKYIGLPPNISEETLSSLHRAHFEFPWSINTKGSDVHGLCYHADKIFWRLHNVRRLSLSWLFFESLSMVQDFALAPLVICASLKHLKLEFCSYYDHVYAFICFLKSFPNLQSLSITFMAKYVRQLVSRKTPNMEQSLQLQRLANGTILTHLKAAELISFEGGASEMSLARNILGSAIILEEMKIRYSREMKEDVGSQLTISHQLAMATKVSPCAVISFSLY